MEFTKQELDVVQVVAAEEMAAAIATLDDLQLAMIGGGSGDTIAY